MVLLLVVEIHRKKSVVVVLPARNLILVSSLLAFRSNFNWTISATPVSNPAS